MCNKVGFAGKVPGVMKAVCVLCRYGYIDFLKYAWSAQMINQFETSHTRVLEGLTVRGWPILMPAIIFCPCVFAQQIDMHFEFIADRVKRAVQNVTSLWC